LGDHCEREKKYARKLDLLIPYLTVSAMPMRYKQLI